MFSSPSRHRRNTPNTALTLALFLAVGGSAPAQKQPAVRSPTPAQIERLLDQAETLVRQGSHAAAEIPLLRARDLAPSDLRVLTALGKDQGLTGQYPQAVATFQQVVQLAPKRADAHLDLAIALADTGQLDAALAQTGLAVSISPTSASAHLNRARILEDLRRPGEARTEFEKASRLNPSNPDTFFYWALLERESGSLSRESALLQRTLKLQPRNFKAALLLGRSFRDQGRNAEAESALRRALALDPTSTEASYLLAQELRESDPQQARSLMADAVEQRRERESVLDRSRALGNQAYGAAQAQHWAEAIDLLTKAIAKCGSCEIAAGLHKDLGLDLCRNGDTDRGKAELQKALALNPDDADVVKALAILNRQ